jgi:predicted N-formylglutamate amidohydrolase
LKKFGLDSSPASSDLLAAGDPCPVIVTNAGAPGPLLLLGDHAGRAIPAGLERLGLGDAELDLHIAWDIGVAGLGAHLSRLLDACFVSQAYSRLVVDCNRKPGAAGSVAQVSDGVRIPGNLDLFDAARAQRLDAIYRPYQQAIGEAIDVRLATRPILVSLHSFTPSMNGFDRPWHLGVLHRGDSPFSETVLAALRARLGDAVGDNEPYRMDETDNTVPLHADPRGLDYLELEVRQDLLADPAGQAAMANLLGPVLLQALAVVRPA